MLSIFYYNPATIAKDDTGDGRDSHCPIQLRRAYDEDHKEQGSGLDRTIPPQLYRNQTLSDSLADSFRPRGGAQFAEN